MADDMSPPPGCSTTVGLPEPVHWRCNRCPPTSISWPDIGYALASRCSRTVSKPAPAEARTITAITGYSSHRRVRLRRCRWAWTAIQTANASSAAGQTQRRTSATWEPNATRSSPDTPRKTAGTKAHRCGWSVKRTESTANIAHPRAKPHSTAAVMSFSWTAMKGAATRSRAATTPVARDPATTRPM